MSTCPRNILKILNYHWWSLKNDQDIVINEVKLIVFFLGNPTKSPTNISFFRIILIRIAEAYNAKYWQYLKNNADAEHKWISRFIHLVHESIYTLSCIFMRILKSLSKFSRHYDIFLCSFCNVCPIHKLSSQLFSLD